MSTATATAPATTVSTPPASRRRRVVALVLLAVGLVSLVTGVKKYQSGAYCDHPLAPWLIVHSCLLITQGLMLLSRYTMARMSATSDIDFAPLIKLSYVASGILFVTTVGWLILGAVWTWGGGKSNCDSDTWTTATTVLCIGFFMVTTVMLLTTYRVSHKDTKEDPDNVAIP